MKGGESWTRKTSTKFPLFETMSKRRKGFASEKMVKRGVRIVHGDKELEEKVGRNDLCPCDSGKLFKSCCLESGYFRWRESGSLLSGNDEVACPEEFRAGLFHADQLVVAILVSPGNNSNVSTSSRRAEG